MRSEHLRLVSSTPVPGTLQCCREARTHLRGFYKQAFSELDQRPGDIRPYLWVNLDIDLISIGTTMFDQYRPIAPSIKRLKFEREHTDEFFFHSEGRDMMLFVNAEEVHVVCADGLWNWAGDSIWWYPWPCPIDNVTFIDIDDGRTARGLELDVVVKQMKLEGRLLADGVAWDSDDPDTWPE
jgi:hypothetical protein